MRPQQELEQASSVADRRADFPALQQAVNGCPLAYLDNAASAQQPSAVIDAVAAYQSHDHSNVHRGVHSLSQRATEAYEGARDKLCEFINATSRTEIVLTSGTTEAINLVAQSFVRPRVGPGDKILISHLEHHANIVPWQLVCEQTGAELVVAPIDERGQVNLDELYALMTEDVRILSIVHVSNALGTVNPVREIVAEAKARGIPTLVDGAQGVPHSRVDVRDIGCDFYTFSGHKMFGPTGTGVLYGREALLEAMPPYKGGGDMILEVRFDKTIYNELPYKFEAGTPNIAGVVGLGAAVDYLNGIGLDRIAAYESELLNYMTARLSQIDGIRLYGTADSKASVQSFLVDDIHPHDRHCAVVAAANRDAFLIEDGAEVMQYFCIPGTVRASLAFYNDHTDVEQLIDALQLAKQLFA